MKALMYQGPRQMPIVDIDEPTPMEDEVKIKVSYVGICGSDIHGYTGESGRKTPPMIMGHEFSGIVAETGCKVTRFKPGDRVTVQPIQFCGICKHCREGQLQVCENRRGLGVWDVNGAFTEYICMKENNVFSLSDNIDLKKAAAIEPFAVAYHAVHRVMPVKGKNILVTGTGTIGLLIISVLHHYGAGTIIVSDLSDERLKLAKSFGADIIVNPAHDNIEKVLSDKSLRNEIDIAIECVGASATFKQTVDLVRIRGTVLCVGNVSKSAPVDLQKITSEEITILGDYGFTENEFAEALELLSSGVIPVELIIGEVSFAEALQAFEDLSNGKGKAVKVIVNMKM